MLISALFKIAKMWSSHVLYRWMDAQAVCILWDTALEKEGNSDEFYHANEPPGYYGK
jgi:hypothetical protein